MYSTCLSVESAGYCDFSFLEGFDIPLRWGVSFVEGEKEIDGVSVLLALDPRRGIGGIMLEADPLLRTDGFEGVRVEGKDDNEVCRLRGALVLAVVPLVEGRYERMEVMLA